MKSKWWLTLFFLFMLMPVSLADQAADVTAECSITFAGQVLTAQSKITDGSYGSHLTLKAAQCIDIALEEEGVSGVFVRFFDQSAELTAYVQTEEAWQAVGAVGRYLTGWIGFDSEVKQFRLVNTSGHNIDIA